MSDVYALVFHHPHQSLPYLTPLPLLLSPHRGIHFPPTAPPGVPAAENPVSPAAEEGAVALRASAALVDELRSQLLVAQQARDTALAKVAALRESAAAAEAAAAAAPTPADVARAEEAATQARMRADAAIARAEAAEKAVATARAEAESAAATARVADEGRRQALSQVFFPPFSLSPSPPSFLHTES